MDAEQRFRAMQTELGFLRAELDLNRKYIFERPLAIVAGAFAAAATLEKLVGFDVLPMLFTALLGFNLWFTYNRLQSNARIISYLQVFHTPSNAAQWIGWEAALHKFRHFETVDPNLPTRPARQQVNRFYGPILLFHLIAAIAVTGFLLAQVYPAGIAFEHLGNVQRFVVILNGVALLALLVLGWRLRPATVRNTIDETRITWLQLLVPEQNKPGCSAKTS
jgi:hypothetical protein